MQIYSSSFVNCTNQNGIVRHFATKYYLCVYLWEKEPGIQVKKKTHTDTHSHAHTLTRSHTLTECNTLIPILFSLSVFTWQSHTHTNTNTHSLTHDFLFFNCYARIVWIRRYIPFYIFRRYLHILIYINFCVPHTFFSDFVFLSVYEYIFPFLGLSGAVVVVQAEFRLNWRGRYACETAGRISL